MRDAAALQVLLAAELSHDKARGLLAGLLRATDPLAFLMHHPSLRDIERQRLSAEPLAALDRGLELGIRPIHASSYSEPLRNASNSPPALFSWGDFSATHAPCIAIVGTRSASAYGRAVAIKFAETFARNGVTVVSGGALGIDSAAHSGALAAGGRTVAVLSGGVDTQYPAVNRALFAKIRETGCLVSQFAIGSRPSDYKFLVRNGLIAALSVGIVVIEAPARSGSLNTGNTANEIGRQVFVVPGQIDHPSFAGSHHLIRDGATLVDHPDQVLESLSIEFNARPIPKPQVEGAAARVLAALSTTPLNEEKISEAVGMPSQEVSAELTLLELEGLAVRGPGGFTRTL